MKDMRDFVNQGLEMGLCKRITAEVDWSLELSHIAKLGPIRPGALAQAMTMDASTLTRNLKSLVDAGWITVTAGSDARSRAVAITEAGREKRHEAQRHWKVAQDGLNNLLGVEKVLALHALIDGALERLSPLDAGADDE